MTSILNMSFDPMKTGRITAYIIFDRERRQDVVSAYPNLKFGEISKLIGTMWHGLLQPEKDRYNEMAKRVNERRKAFSTVTSMSNIPK